MASTLITVGQLMEHIETDLSDEVLTRLLESADAEIIRAYGPHDGEQSALVAGRGYRIWLPRPAESITEIVEWTGWETPGDADPVSADKYALEHGGRTIFRADAPFMTNVQITYTPIADNPRRTMALIDLVKLEVQFSGCQGRCENVPAGRSKTVPLNAVEWASRFVGRWRSGSVR